MISKWNHRQLLNTKSLVFAALFGIMSFVCPTPASAQQAWRYDVKDHASDIQHLARDIRREVLHDAKGSRQFGPLLAATGRLEGNAAVLRAWAKHQGPLDLRKQLGKVECAHKDLVRLVSEAKHDLRFHHGGFSCPRLDALLCEVCDHITHAKGDIPTMHHHHHDVHHGVIQEVYPTPRPFCGTGVGRVEIAPGPIHGLHGAPHTTVTQHEIFNRHGSRKQTRVHKVYNGHNPYSRVGVTKTKTVETFHTHRRSGSSRTKHHNGRYGHHRNPYAGRSKGVRFDGGGITIQGRNVGFRINF